MLFRHVETLCDLGFDAFCMTGSGSVTPNWFSHRAPLMPPQALRPDDIVVIADDASDALKLNATRSERAVVFCQDPINFAAKSLDAMDLFPGAKFPTLMANSPSVAATLTRLYPHANVEMVPCFADDRLFGPASEKCLEISYTPRKRPLEVAAIHGLFQRLYRSHERLAWNPLINCSEAEVAAEFGRSGLFLSLSRMESVGMTTLEAMASGCVCAGFRGVGGNSFASSENGFWAPDDDCVAAVDAIAEAADLYKTGGPGLSQLTEASVETARQWSYGRFRTTLEEVWMRIAPEARSGIVCSA